MFDLEGNYLKSQQLAELDVMDGRFCPALTMGTALVKGVKTPLIKDVHLMIEDPLANSMRI